MKKVGLLLGVISAAVVLVLGGIWAFVDVNSYREPIQTALSRQLARKVTLGRMQLGLLPLRIRVENPVIAEDESLGERPPFVRAEELSVYMDLMPLLTGKVKIDTLDLRRPVVELVKNEE